jgi:hypothetical protein
VRFLHLTMLSANLTVGTAADQQTIFEFKLFAFEGSIKDFQLKHLGWGSWSLFANLNTLPGCIPLLGHWFHVWLMIGEVRASWCLSAAIVTALSRLRA